MDPIAAGAAAGLTGVATQAVKDAYSALKSTRRARFPRFDVGLLEERPSSQAKQPSLSEDLRGVGADRDLELLQLAQAMVRVHQSQAAPDVIENTVINSPTEFVDGRLACQSAAGFDRR